MNFLALLPIFQTLIERIFPDKEKQAQANIELQKLLLEAQARQSEADARKMEADANIAQSAALTIKAEAESNSWMARNWRPSLMYLIMLLIAYNFMLAPLLQSIGLKLLITPIPNDMWTLLTLSVTGYVAGRSGERMMGLYADAKSSSAESNAQAEVAKFNSQKYFEARRRVMYPNGMTQEQVNMENQVLKESGLIS